MCVHGWPVQLHYHGYLDGASLHPSKRAYRQQTFVGREPSPLPKKVLSLWVCEQQSETAPKQQNYLVLLVLLGDYVGFALQCRVFGGRGWGLHLIRGTSS